MIRAFVICVFLFTLFVVIFSAFNIYYYNKVKKAVNSPLTATEANVMIGFNVAFLILAFIGLCYSVYILLGSFVVVTQAAGNAKQAVVSAANAARQRVVTYANAPIDNPKYVKSVVYTPPPNGDVEMKSMKSM
jgi:hypothetical protein